MDLMAWAQSLVEEKIEDRYQIKRVVSAGGMGALTCADHQRISRSVALKIVPAFREDLVARLQTEAEAASKVQHPALVDVYDFGHDRRVGIWYLAEQFLDGKDLEYELRQQGPFGAECALQLLYPVMTAVAELHHQGIVHRDIKLENIVLIQDRKGVERAVLVDFGLADFMDRPPKPHSGTVMGSPSVMSPEQVRGEEPIGPCSDVWSMGIVLFTLITGHSPFSRGTDAATLRAILQDPVPRLNEINPAFSEPFSNILRKTMERSTRDRYATMDALLKDLEHCPLYAKRARAKHAPISVSDVTRPVVHRSV